MANDCTDNQYLAAMAMIKRRESIIAEVARISRQIDELVRLRAETRTEARRLKSSSIAEITGLPVVTVERISERRSKRAANLDRDF